MRVKFAPELYNDEAASHVLDEIIFLFMKDKHVWELNDPTELEGARWLESDKDGRAGARIFAEVKKIITRGIYIPKGALMHSTQCIVVINVRDPSTELPIDIAVEWLRTPVKVVVENERSDGGFLQAIIKTLGGRAVRRAAGNGLWEVQHAGGINDVPNCIDTLLAKYSRPLRIFTFVDSEGRVPGEVRASAERVREHCTARKIPFWILSKREIENYLPDKILANISNRQSVWEAVSKLSPSQRDHYPMKEGFKSHGNGARVPEDQRALFDGLPDDVLKGLVGGFGDDVAAHFATSGDLTAAEFERRCSSNPTELKQLIDQIERLI